ncbi:MAG: SIR2 family protein [Lachnospiraceae bacterium]|nr:SIR2 family protein [Lachnospiraceae bacterium]
MTLSEVVSKFNTTPFIFAGSGITRRYYGLPDWSGLLSMFANKVKKDRFAYRLYEFKAKQEVENDDIMPYIATLIERDFNEAWFENQSDVRSGEERVDKAVENGVSPFKAEICAYIRSRKDAVSDYEEEIKKLKNISKNNISGIITTNYDEFFENIFDGYKTFVGQDELVFSQLQGIAEIYKIHGSVSREESIIINQEDYQLFYSKSKYLAAKLMTIFMEYPIIFIGYSMTDSDIRTILSNIVQCLPKEKMYLMQNRFVFVEYKPDEVDVVVSSHSMVLENKTIEMTKISLSDFGKLYDALSKKKASLPVKVLRRFKDDIYSFVLTNEPTEKMRVAPLDDDRIDEETLAITIGLASTGTFGLARAVDAEKWYKNIICHDLQYTSDQLLEYAYEELAKQNSRKIPIWYYLKQAKGTFTDIINKAPKSYDEIVTQVSIERNKTAVGLRTMKEVWEQEKQNYKKALRLMGAIPYDKVNIDVLENVLTELFLKKPDCLKTKDANIKSNIKRLIRIYDFLKFAN